MPIPCSNYTNDFLHVNEIQNSSRPTRVFCLPTSLDLAASNLPLPILYAQASCLYLNITNIHLPWDLKRPTNIQMTSYPTFFQHLVYRVFPR